MAVICIADLALTPCPKIPEDLTLVLKFFGLSHERKSLENRFMEPPLGNKKACTKVNAELIRSIWCFGAGLYCLLIPMSLVQSVLQANDLEDRTHRELARWVLCFAPMCVREEVNKVAQFHTFQEVSKGLLLRKSKHCLPFGDPCA